jgi:hypothetical protein
LCPAIVVLALASTASLDAAVAFRTIVQGTDSKIDARRELVAHTAGAWQLIWFKHRGTYDAPPVDPSREMVVAVFAGSRPTGAHTVHVVSVNREGRTLVVRYRLQTAQAAARIDGTTTPFHIIAVPQDGVAVKFLEVRDVYPARRP